MASSFTSRCSINELSQELIDEIVDTSFYCAVKFWGLQWEALSCCSLVCRSFVPRSRVHMFAFISLPGKGGESNDYTKIASLIQLIDNRSVIANHIQELELKVHDGRSTWMYDRPEMVKLMELITASTSPLKKLVFTAGRMDRVFYAPTVPLMKRFVYPHIAFNVTTIHLTFISGVPPQLVSSCVNLEDLVMIYAKIRDEDDGPSSMSYPKIHNFKYLGNAKNLLGVCSCLNYKFSDLRRFTFITDEVEDFVLVYKIIDISKGSLEELSFTVHKYQYATQPSIALILEGQSTLRALTLDVSFSIPDSNNLVDICSVLKTISTNNNNLREFNLTFAVGYRGIGVHPNHLQSAVLDNADWEGLGNKISKIAAGRRFKLFLRMDYRPLRVTSDAPGEGWIWILFEEAFQSLIDGPLASLKSNPGISIITQKILSG